MGNVSPRSKVNAKVDAQIEATLQDEEKLNDSIFKVLLLGAGEAGKSTFFKQMIFGYKDGFSRDSRMEFIDGIRNSFWSGLKTIAHTQVLLQEEHGLSISVENREFHEILLDDDGPPISIDYSEQIQNYWNDPAIQADWTYRCKIQVAESMEYFVSRVPEILEDDYVPSDDDILRMRVRTTGISQLQFASRDGKEFSLIDVGGQRSERKKWIKCFDGVHAVLFLAAINEYDQNIFEDEKTNRIDEALNLFDQIVNDQVFENKVLVLFLNKIDLFREKIADVPLSSKFPEYNGDDSFELCSLYMKQLFLSRCRIRKPQTIIVHFTCVTDTSNAINVFKAVKKSILHKSLEESGLDVKSLY